MKMLGQVGNLKEAFLGVRLGGDPGSLSFLLNHGKCVTSLLAGDVSLLTGSGDTKSTFEGIHGKVLALSTESAHEAIQVNGPDHGPSRALLQQPPSLWETFRRTVGCP